jgi:Tfp pilus assembly protein PilP
MRANPACSTGARCVPITQIVLKGVVKTQAGMIAMVESAARKQYNLREKDSVMNGFVLRITSDSIVFRETVYDTLGNATTKEVVKRVTVPAV